MYARMPTIFAKNKSVDQEANSTLKLNTDGTEENPVLGIQQLVEEGGSAAYQLYQQQSEKMLRDRLIEQNNGVFMANIEGIKLARNESFSRILMPRNFTHESTLTPHMPQGLNETALEKEIKRIVELQSATIDNSLV